MPSVFERFFYFWSLVFVFICCSTLVGADPRQPLPQSPFVSDEQSNNVKFPVRHHKVAIIGAGAAGSSAAYHLRRLSSDSSPQKDIDLTIFESQNHVGGRSTTIDVFGESHYPTELGASIFSAKHNPILSDAVKEFNFTTSRLSLNSKPQKQGNSKYVLGVWNGHDFVFRTRSDEDNSFSWNWLWDLASMLWQYGLSPLKTRRLMQNTFAEYEKLYHEPLFPFNSLSKVATNSGLTESTSVTGWEFLLGNDVAEDFARDIVQASTRVNYGQNLGLINGLETMVCMATEAAVAVEGGNWRIFDRMIQQSGGNLRLQTTVEKIHQLSEGGYRVTSHRSTSDLTEAQDEEVFDIVILAAPHQFADVQFSPPLPISRAPEQIPYVSLYVTLLTSPHRPSPGFFNSSGTEADASSIPWSVITTLPPSDQSPTEHDPSHSMHGVGPAGFWSISTLRTLQVNNSMGEPEEQFLYKIFTPDPLNDTFLSDLFDISPVPASIETVFADTDSNQSGRPFSKEDISYLYTKKWDYAYPYAFPRLSDFPNLNLDGASLYYTSGMETLISTMETSALMGKNVAALILKDINDQLLKPGLSYS